MPKKVTKKQRIKALENEVLTLYAFLGAVTSTAQPVKVIKMEPFSEFQKKLRDTEAKYASKAS
jgi:hypothetical protein